jgi:colanic acid biosynthesis glycosyl transferase WcaI
MKLGRYRRTHDKDRFRLGNIAIRTMRILLITFQFPPEMTGTGPLLGELCEDLRGQGHEITAIVGPLHHNFEDIPPRYRSRLLTREFLCGANVTRVNMALTRSMWANKLIGYVYFPAASTLLGVLARRRDVILCSSPPLWLGLAARLVSLLKRAPYVYVAQDLWPSAPVRLGLWRNPLLIVFFSWMERYVYARAKRVVIIADRMRETVRAAGLPDDRITTIENWVDVNFIRPGNRDNGFRRQVARPDDFVVLYAGNMGHSHAIDVVLRAAALLREHKDIRFILVGAGTQKDRLVRMAEAMALEQVQFLPLQPRERLPEVIAAADTCLVPLRTGLSTASLPSKIYTYMSGARPLVATLDPGEAAWELIERAQCGLLVEPERPKDLGDAILKLYHDPGLRERMGANGRRYAETHCDRTLCTRAYEEMLRKAAELPA